MLWSDSKHGFRGVDDSLAVAILRGSYDPDPYPEIGVSRCRLSLVVADAAGNRDLLRRAAQLNHPPDVVAAKRQAGDLPPVHSFLRLKEGAALLSAVKKPEDGDGLIVRLFETDGRTGQAVIEFARRVRSVEAVDVNERPAVDGKAELYGRHGVRAALRPFGVTTLRLTFEPEQE